MSTNQHNKAQESAAAGEPYQEPHDVTNRILDSVFGIYGGDADKQNSDAKAGYANGANQRPD